MNVHCQDCKSREATVHLTQIMNNEKIALSLCSECAAARGFHSPLDNVPFPLADILTGIAGDSGLLGTEDETKSLTCEGCGLTFEQFTRQGRFGCGECYKSFRPRLESIMRKIHGASIHRGRNPQIVEGVVDGGQALPIQEEERISDELRKAIEMEDFERAAELRDRLKDLRQTVESE
jgi:protein arginine kinase activator